MNKHLATESLWPMVYGNTQQSPIPIMRVIGDSGRGKSTLIASIARQPRLDREGNANDPMTLVFDTELSYPTLAGQYALDVVDVASLIENLPKSDRDKPKDFQLFLAYLKFFDGGHKYDHLLKRYSDGHYRVIAIDSATKLFNGAQLYLKANPKTMTEYQNNYTGQIGQQTSWADASRWWGVHLQELSQKANDTVVVAFHRKKDYKTNKMALRGANITEWVTLSLTLFNEMDVAEAKAADLDAPCWFAVVDKQRLDGTHFYDVNGNLLDEPIIAKVLPKVIIPKENESFAAAIRSYLKNPLPGYGKLDQVDESVFNAAEEVASPEDLSLAYGLEINNAKKEMIARLIKGAHYTDRDAIAVAITNLGLVSDVNTLEKIDSVEEKLIKYAAGEPVFTEPVEIPL